MHIPVSPRRQLRTSEYRSGYWVGQGRLMVVWFCGRPEVSSLFGGAQLSPTKCYLSATITTDELDARGMRWWSSQDECRCVPTTPPPSPPPQKIYFCGQSGACAKR
eukprot:3628541-Pleurochrysis_carterae.AAC.3